MTEFINEYCMHDHTCGELRAARQDKGALRFFAFTVALLDGRDHKRGAAHAEHDALKRAEVALRNHVADHLPHKTDGAHAKHRTSHIAQ